MKFQITYFNKLKQLYNQSNDIVYNTDFKSYETSSFEVCKKLLKDFLDPPEAELSKEIIENDFSSKTFPLTEEKTIAIMDYYNGRLALYKTILDDFYEAVEAEKSLYKRYDIPAKYNEFLFYNENFSTTVQIDSYIELKIS